MLDLTRILPFMELALKQAKLALDRLEVPVGCVIVEDGRVIATGCNRTSQTRNATRHAEMEAIDALMEQWQKEGLDSTQVAQRFSACDLYVTCEPCIMCAAALSILGFREVYYGCANDKFGGCGSILSLHEGALPEFSSTTSEARAFKVTGGILSEEAILLFRGFYEQGNPNGAKIIDQSLLEFYSDSSDIKPLRRKTAGMWKIRIGGWIRCGYSIQCRYMSE